uniref:Coiled-coil domain containing 151 n=1 Tax=Nothobranchius furzeri TaxID=105023 RepID=A0A1A8UBU9_NOTFU
MKKTRESILQLRQDNKRLYRKVAEAKAGDEHIIRVAFQNKGLKQDAFHNMSGKAALTAVDQKVLSKTKRLNASKHTTRTYQQRLDELKREYERIKPEGGSGAVSSSAWERKKEEDVMEAVLELLAQCELQLQLLQKEFEGKDLTAIMKEMGEDEFYIRIEENLPEYNTRVRLPEAQPLELSDDAAKRSDEDEPGVLSREVLKRQSQLIVDSNLKKKTWKRKKSKFWPKEEI